MSAAIVLPAVLDIQQAAALRAQLLAARGGPVTLDASAVERLGALCLQVLLAAQQTWATDGAAIAITPTSDAFVQQWAAFGAPLSNLGWGESA